jgi:hypothetical protein
LSLVADRHVQQYLRLGQTKEERTKRKYAGVISQKLKLFNLGKSHVGCSYLCEERTSFTKPPISTGITKEKNH